MNEWNSVFGGGNGVKSTHKASVIFLFCASLIFLASACLGDRGPGITYVNRTSTPILINLGIVAKDFSGQYTPRPEVANEGPINPGQTKRFFYFNVPLSKDAGERGKYVITAMRQPDAAIVYQHVFTWTELYDSGWTVVIEEPAGQK